MDHNKLLKILQKMGISDHLTCLLRNLSEGQEATVKKKKKEEEATVRTGQRATDWFQIGK